VQIFARLLILTDSCVQMGKLVSVFSDVCAFVLIEVAPRRRMGELYSSVYS
jgi:hypothetical protein